jgi:hypothetical protein
VSSASALEFVFLFSCLLQPFLLKLSNFYIHILLSDSNPLRHLPLPFSRNAKPSPGPSINPNVAASPLSADLFAEQNPNLLHHPTRTSVRAGYLEKPSGLWRDSSFGGRSSVMGQAGRTVLGCVPIISRSPGRLFFADLPSISWTKWESIASLQSHRILMATTSPNQPGLPSPFAQLAISLSVYLGHCFPPSPSISSSTSSSDGQLPPAEMSSFGFNSVGEVLDLCAAVRSLLSSIPLSHVPFTLDSDHSILSLVSPSSLPIPSPSPPLPSLPSASRSPRPSLSSTTPAGQMP